jgi:lantibiotic biosynthesis protein
MKDLMAKNWTPIISGDRLTLTADIIADVDACVGDMLSDALNRDMAGEQQYQYKFAASAGWAGYSIFYAYKHLLEGDRKSLERCNSALMLAANALAAYKFTPSLYGGLTGVGWAIEHANSVLGKDKVESSVELQELNEQIDEFLLQWLLKDTGDRDFDLINGLVGIGVYFLERLPRDAARGSLEEIVRQLSARAKSDADGFCWYTPPSLIPYTQIAEHPKGYYNLGLAHGIPGIIVFLSRAYAANVKQDDTERLLRGAVSWLLRQKLPDSEISAFATTISETSSPRAARLAWCYGDAGIAAALFAAANSLSDEAIQEAALQIARKAAHRTIANSGVVDAAICHGAFGLAHIFNRFYQQTQEDLFLDKALMWFDCGCSMRRRGAGIAGYLFHDLDDNGLMNWVGRPGLLVGVTGLAMVALCGLGHRAPEWDRFFLLDMCN